MARSRKHDTQMNYGDIPRVLPRKHKKSGLMKRVLFYGFLWGCLSIALFISVLYLRLPDINELRNVRYQQPLKILTADGALISQIGQIKRDPLIYEDIPSHLINALLSAEDSRFFQHIGLDFRSLARAVYQLVTASQTQTGGSTITMQVARNYYLTRDRTIMRKLNEILLAIKMERIINKEEILSLYVNTIFLGFKSFGMKAAAKTYYNKDLSDLSLAQYAMLAALPKAPSGMNPISNPQRANQRRDWILGRMAELGYISRADYLNAVSQELSASPYDSGTEVEGLYLAEAARLELLANPDKYNVTIDDLYTGGYQVYTSANKKMQQSANEAVRNGLLNYDKRHGWRGSEKSFINLRSTDDFTQENPLYIEALAELDSISSYDNSLEPGIVKQVNKQSVEVVLSSGESIVIDWKGLKWAAPYISDQKTGEYPKSAEELVAVGDLVRISQDFYEAAGSPRERIIRLSQIPRAEGAILAVNPNNGLILAMVGGYHFQLTKFNRALQARRQIGSAIKPFLYAAALERGYNGADLFNDAPFVAKSNSNLVWRPSNAGNTFLGYIPLREGLFRSRNLISVRLMRKIRVSRTREFMQKFALPAKHLPNDLSLALGSAELTLLEAARAYSVFANGGYLIEPRLILRIEYADGQVLYEAKNLETIKPKYVSNECADCNDSSLRYSFSQNKITQCNNFCTLDNKAKRSDDNSFSAFDATSEEKAVVPYARVISPELHYQIHSILKDVVARGTARRALALGRKDIAGKTGTTQNFVDAWFAGYNPNLVAITWMGFDKPSSLGPSEYGGVAALPIWIDFMNDALRGTSHKDFYRPLGLVEVNATSANDGGDRQFTEYVNKKHLQEYLNRIENDSAYTDYKYRILDSDNLNLDPQRRSNILDENEEDVPKQEVKDLF
ncbi:MAG: PBP1A family penicillin-binding protein [Candidatus Portiera sp.]|nr:PBP1A family penicillin-binding protein [Portiera sp.]